jgi:hypothetical protein
MLLSQRWSPLDDLRPWGNVPMEVVEIVEGTLSSGLVIDGDNVHPSPPQQACPVASAGTNFKKGRSRCKSC